MCGFVGFIDETENFESALPMIGRMAGAIAHRGPDDAGYYTEQPIAVGHRRLSIVDIDGGRQPMLSVDKSLVLVFNGEIYNYQSIKRELIEKGYRFRTQCDSEVLLYGYMEYGYELPRHLRGMFSFVIWDGKYKRLFGARDVFGIKPFYYARMSTAFLFGSEIKSFFEHPLFCKRLNEKLLPAYLSFQYTPPCRETFFEGVYKLPPAHTLIYEEGSVTISPYYELQFAPEETEEVPYEQWTERIEAAVADSVEAHKLSDVEVGSFLSSGVDSSYISAIAGVNKTFTVGFECVGGAYSEIDYARELSEHIGVRNYSQIINPGEYWNTISQVQHHMDEPLADPSAVALYFLCKLASKHCKVVLSGEGADELFGGYNIYSEPLSFQLYDKLPFKVRQLIGRWAGKLPPHRGLNFLIRRGQKLEERYIGNAYIFSPREAKSILRKCQDEMVATNYTELIYEKMQVKDPVTRMQTLDIHSWLVGDILQKADKMSMAHSLELRVPFLDKEVWEVARRLPASERTTRKETKVALRRAARRHIPERWASKRKLGFPVPIRIWLREDKYYEQVKDTFLSPTAESFFNTDVLIKLLDQHKQGTRDNSRKIYTVYTFLIWYHEHFC